MTNEDFKEIIRRKINEKKQEKKKLQLKPNADDKINECTIEIEALESICDYPSIYAVFNASDEEIKTIIKSYKEEIKKKVERISQEFDEITNDYSDTNFLNEVAAYQLLAILSLVTHPYSMEKQRYTSDNIRWLI